MKLENIQKLSEKELSTRIVIPLLKSMGYKSVTYTCGTDEFGRDIIFYDEDKFNNKKWKAAQVKSVNIQGTSSRAGNIQEIINQIQEAFDNPYFNSSSGEEVLINEVYIITSRSITPKAKLAIKNKFQYKPVFFIEGQGLVNYLDKFVPDILDKTDKAKGITYRIKKFLKSGEQFDIRELETWFSNKNNLQLENESADFVSKQIFKYFFRNPSMEYEENINWNILSWLDNLSNSNIVLSRQIQEFLEDFPYYSEFQAPGLYLSFLKSLKKIKYISPRIYCKIKIDSSSFFHNIEKSFAVLDSGVDRNHILNHLFEEGDVLLDFLSDEKLVIDVDEKYIIPILIGMKHHSAASAFLEKKENPEKFLAQSFIFCVNCGLNEDYRRKTSSIVNKFLEFVRMTKLENTFLLHLPSNYKILALWGLNRGKEAKELLKVKKTFDGFPTSSVDYLPKAYRLFFGKSEDFFREIDGVTIPKIPEIYDEMAELKYAINDFEGSLKLIEIAIENSDKLKKYYLLKFMKRHKAHCLFNLKHYSECLKVLEALIKEGGKTDFELYEACKKEIKNIGIQPKKT